MQHNQWHGHVATKPGACAVARAKCSTVSASATVTVSVSANDVPTNDTGQ